MDTKDAYIEHLENTISSLQKQVDNLTEMIILLRKEKFGSSSEKTPAKQIDGQLSLFNEAEVEAASKPEEPIVQKVDGYYRKPFRTKRAELIKDLPVREIPCDIPCDIPDEDMYCDQCGTTLKLIGYEKVREELEYIPAKLQIVRYNRAACECPKCKHTEHPFIKKAESPSSLMNHSLASPSSVANVMYQKYVNSVPLYRQEKDWENLGLSLTRATIFMMKTTSFSLEMNFSLLLFRIKVIEFCLSIPNPKSKRSYHVSAIILPKVKEIYLLYYLQPNSEYVQVIFAGLRFLIFTGNAILSNSFNSKQVFLINFLYLKILSLP